jgi:hypothetical protein
VQQAQRFLVTGDPLTWTPTAADPAQHGRAGSPPHPQDLERRVHRRAGGQARGNRAALQGVQAWERVGRFPTDLPERLLPYVAITSSGSAETPVRDAESYSSRMLFSIGVIAGAGGENAEEDARDLAGDYGHALTAALVHKGITSPLITDVIWRVQNLGERPPIADLSVQAAVNTFWVDVDGVLDLYGGPPTPPPDPVPPPRPPPGGGGRLTIDTETPT